MVFSALFRGLASALGLGGGGGGGDQEETTWSNARGAAAPASPTKRARTGPGRRGAAAPPDPPLQPVLQDAPAGDGGVQGLDWDAATTDCEEIECDGAGTQAGRRTQAAAGGAGTGAGAGRGKPAGPRRPKPGRKK